jgi:hypothetical protein
MKRKFTGALLVCMFLLTLVSFGRTQIIAPNPTDSQVPGEILMGLIGKYMAMVQQHQNLIAQGGTPDSIIEFRAAAKLTMVEGADSELDSVLTELSRIALWVKVNILARYPDLVRMDLSGSLGHMEILSTATGSVFVLRDEAVFTVLPPDGDIADVLPIGTLPMDFGSLASLGLLQGEIDPAVLSSLLGAAMEYGGLELTPEGWAHVVRLTLADTGEILTLWVLDETWDLCKVGLDNLEAGISVIMVIENIEIVAATLPESALAVDTSTLAELPCEEFLAILDLKTLSVALRGVPVAADLSVSVPEVRQGEQVVVRSNGMDAEDVESELIAEMEYRGPGGSWMPLDASYVGIAPLGRWEAALILPTNEVPGSYDFRVSYTDTGGIVSEPLELLAALNVIALLPQVVDVSPRDRESNVPVSAQVVVSFSQDMDKASVESAFSLADASGQAVPGSFEWSDATFAFKPDQELLYGQDYLARILGTAAGVNTATLDADMDGAGEGSPEDDFSWSFTTEYAPVPKVSEVSPGDRQLNVLVSAQVSVGFTEIMDQASAENAFSLTSSVGQAVSGSFEWSDNTMTFIPSQDLEYNATYRARVAGTAVSGLGVGLDANGNGVPEGSPKDDLSWWFSTEKFPVLGVRPASQTALGGDFVIVDIVAQSVSQLSSFSVTVDFDPTILMILKVERASFAIWRPRPKIIEDVDMWRATVIDNEQGLITMGADSTRKGGVSGTGTIATITFQAIGVGESPVQLQDVSFVNALGEDISPELSDGSVQVLEFSPWDANQDGVVNIHDFIIIQSDRGAATDVNGDGVTNILDMVAAAGGALSSPASVPLDDGLGPNYPNPFNPETWIPYQLARGANAVIRIYSGTGQLVRSLDLGYRHPGRYITKACAAHWDGTNEDGERVGSGIYYYAIKAGAFSAVRKMVVSE